MASDSDSYILPYILGAVVVGGIIYMYRRPVINKLISCGNWAVDKFVDFKWKYLEPAGQGVIRHERNENKRCFLIGCQGNHIIYQYQDKWYISPALVPPFYSEINQVYDDEESIVDIKLYRDGTMLKRTGRNIEPEWNRICETVGCFAGPLYDFHGVIPTIKVLRYFCNTPLLKSVNKIVVCTEHLREFVIS
jgi:hypothetical protein